MADVELDPPGPGTMIVTKPCPVCEDVSRVRVDQTKYQQYVGGKNIQDVWPDATSDERERLQTGIHPPCWTVLFPDEDEEE